VRLSDKMFIILFFRLLDFIMGNEPEDSLVNPGDVNPFKEKKTCVVL